MSGISRIAWSLKRIGAGGQQLLWVVGQVTNTIAHALPPAKQCQELWVTMRPVAWTYNGHAAAGMSLLPTRS